MRLPTRPDLQFINPLGALFAGREAFRALHAFLFSGPFRGSQDGVSCRLRKGFIRRNDEGQMTDLLVVSGRHWSA
jgi:hypothetical protein